MTQDELMGFAKNAAKNGYAPQTGYVVGAALLAKSGTVYIGVNVEDNKIPALSVCAERNAIQTAISHGDKEFSAIAIAGKRIENDYFDETVTPCGMCLQYMIDMCKNIDVICYVEGKQICKNVKDFLNVPFDFDEK